jgi:hypothetical protein
MRKFPTLPDIDPRMVIHRAAHAAYNDAIKTCATTWRNYRAMKRALVKTPIGKLPPGFSSTVDAQKAIVLDVQYNTLLAVQKWAVCQDFSNDPIDKAMIGLILQMHNGFKPRPLRLKKILKKAKKMSMYQK